jgi:two-component system, cell cycle sensor histidine kinase and response regulator CckA
MVERSEKWVTTESILRAVLESPRDIMILASDRQHRYLAFNDAHRRGMKAGVGIDIAVGMNVLDLVPPDMAKRAKVNVDRALAGEHVVLVEEMGEGDDPLKKQYFEVTHCPIFAADGSVLGQTVFHINITAERHLLYEVQAHRAGLEKMVAERTVALQRSEELYRTLVQNAPIAVFVHRGDTLVYVNPAAVALCRERDAAALRVRSLRDIIWPAIVPNEGQTRVERVVRAADDASVDVEWKSIGVEFEGASATLSLAVDVSARKRAEAERIRLEEQMRETQKLESLGVLAGGIAHDFNNLLVGIMGNADLAMNGLKAGRLDSDLTTQLHRIKTAALRAAELTGKMLAYSGKGKFVVSAIDLNELTREMADLAYVSVPKGAELVLELAPGLPAFEGDIAQIRQIVMNLMTNGAEALSDQAGTITLRTSVVMVGRSGSPAPIVDDTLAPGPYVCLEVTDTGVGMDELTRKRIFDPFFTTKTNGRGLGLAAVVGIVRAHEGAIRVTSTVGEGSTFRVLFPISDRPVAVPSAPAEPEEWRTTGTVLIADDEPRVRQVLAMMLGDIGFNVLHASSASGCLEVYRANAAAIDAVMVDLQMPGGGGREVVRVLRAEGHQVPIVVSSGYSEESVGPELRSDNRLSFLEKPFEYSTFVRTLKGAIASA